MVFAHANEASGYSLDGRQTSMKLALQYRGPLRPDGKPCQSEGSDVRMALLREDAQPRRTSTMRAHVLVVKMLALSPSRAAAGGFALKCEANDKSFSLDKGVVTIAGLDGETVEDEYYADSSTRLMSYELQDVLQDVGPKFFIDLPATYENARNMANVIRKRAFKDPCGDKGQRFPRRFRSETTALGLGGQAAGRNPGRRRWHC